MDRRRFVGGVGLAALARPAVWSEQRRGSTATGADDRAVWLRWVQRVADPVLTAMRQGKLRATMPVEAAPGHAQERAVGTHLEAFARLLMGLAPWLELDAAPGESSAETALRTRYRSAAQAALASAVDPASPDYMRFGASSQTLVDASFLALALLRAPGQLIDTMSATTSRQLVAAMLAERSVLPGLNNWILFSAMNEALLFRLGAEWDRVRVAYALNELQAWYVGDGTYGDGPHYHADFYNSYVMHPYLLMLLDTLRGQQAAWTAAEAPIHAHSTRYAAIQERTIGPDGSFPVLGRSICYRGGAFHLLADAALRGMLPQPVSPAQARCALTAVQQRTLDAAGTFDTGGWLRIGLAGHQPSLAETYISTGSLYLCSATWLPLGLPPAHPFWAGADTAWTQKAVWSGQDAKADHAVD